MAIIDVVSWNPTSNNVYAYRFPETNLSTATQLVVRESQEAVLFSNGELMGKFGPGRHTLTTENLPILRRLYGLPFGGENPFTAEIWFVNKTAPLNIDWQTSPMRILDPEYGQMIPIIADGRYGLKVQDAEKFLVQLVGSMTSFTDVELTDHFKGMLISRTNSCISTYMTANHAGINQVSAHLDDLSTYIKQSMTPFWQDYGFLLTGFYITEINVDTSTEEGKMIARAMSQRSAQAIAGYTWQQNRMFDVADNAASNNNGIGILAAGMLSGSFGISQGNNNGGTNPLMQPGNTNSGQGQSNYGAARTQEWFCSVCGSKHPVTMLYCDNCGHKYHPCPMCGSDNPDEAVRCIKCGTLLNTEQPSSSTYCVQCQKPIKPGTKFCPYCGARQKGK